MEKLLESNPNATKAIKKWFTYKLIESLNNNTEITEELKKAFLDNPIPDEDLEKMIENSPRFLFDVLDANEIFIDVIPSKVNEKVNFSYNINESEVISGSWEYRKDAELAAIKVAYVMLERRLKS